jgi:serine/threonine protein phosphatase PrpC
MFHPYWEWGACVPELGVDVSACVSRGPRGYQEDRVSACVSRALRVLVLLVADGHGGSGVSHFVQQHLCESVVRAMESAGVVDEAVLRGCIRECDDRVRGIGGMEECGACIVVACVCDDRLLLASLGDCSAIVDGERVFRPHSVQEDRERLSRLPAGSHYVESRRRLVCGGRSFAFTRSIGDFCAKIGQDESLFAVSREPDVRVLPRPSHYMLLCSDGLTDGLDDQSIHRCVVDLCGSLLSPSQRHCVPQLLSYYASRSSRDNISCVFADFSRFFPRIEQQALPPSASTLADICSLRLSCEEHLCHDMRHHLYPHLPH